MSGAGTRIKDHYLDSYRQVFLNVLRTQLGRRGVDSGVEGCLHLAQSVDLAQLLPMADSQLTQASYYAVVIHPFATNTLTQYDSQLTQASQDFHSQSLCKRTSSHKMSPSTCRHARLWWSTVCIPTQHLDIR